MPGWLFCPHLFEFHFWNTVSADSCAFQFKLPFVFFDILIREYDQLRVISFLRDAMQSNVVIVSILLGRAECVRHNPGILE